MTQRIQWDQFTLLMSFHFPSTSSEQRGGINLLNNYNDDNLHVVLFCGRCSSVSGSIETKTNRSLELSSRKFTSWVLTPAQELCSRKFTSWVLTPAQELCRRKFSSWVLTPALKLCSRKFRSWVLTPAQEFRSRELSSWVLSPGQELCSRDFSSWVLTPA